MLPLILAAVGGYLIGNSIDSKDKYADGGEIYSLAENMTDAEYEKKLSGLNKKQKKNYESLVSLGDSPKLALATTLLSNEVKWSDDTIRAYTMADGGRTEDDGGSTRRQIQLQEIERFVHQQGTVVQEENFEEVPVQHLHPSKKLKIKGIDIPFVGTDAVYSANGKKYSYSNLSDDDIKKIHYRIIGMYD